ncbi:MAG: HAD family hydrolase [Candidatus Zixiibacteriota bacterium]
MKWKLYKLNLSNIKNVIFDLDGTLVDSSAGIASATNYALSKENEPNRTIDEIKPFIGFPLEEMFAAFSQKPADRLWQHFRERAREIMVDSTEPLDGAERLIHKLKKMKIHLAIGSTKITPHIKGILAKLGWDNYIDFIAGADSVKNVKPAPDIFLDLLQRMNGSPDDSIVIGDTINDILAAQSASLRTIAVKSPYGHHAELIQCKPDMIVDNLNEIINIFERAV